MDQNMNGMNEPQENVLAGTVGAFLFALAGGVVWFLLYQIGFMAGLSGIVGVICAVKGYGIFAKKESRLGVVISVIAAVAVMVLAWYLCLSLDVYNAYIEWFKAGEINYTISFVDAVKTAYLFLEESEIALGYFKDLGIGLLLCAVGAGSYISAALKRVQAKSASSDATPPVDPQNDPRV